MKPSAAMIFAAGFGTRMGLLTKDKPKPMIPVAGRPMIDHALEIAREASIEQIVINTHYKAEVLTSYLGAQSDIAYSPESAPPLETGGGLKQALPLLGSDPVFTLNPDAVWTGPNPLIALGDSWQPDKMDALLMLIPTDQATGHKGGDFALRPDGRIIRGNDFVYTGAQITATHGLAAFDQRVFSMNLLWDRMIEQGRLFGCVHPGGWVDVGSPDGIELAEDMLGASGNV